MRAVDSLKVNSEKWRKMFYIKKLTFRFFVLKGRQIQNDNDIKSFDLYPFKEKVIEVQETLFTKKRISSH